MLETDEQQELESDVEPVPGAASLRDRLAHDRDRIATFGGVPSLRSDDFRELLDADPEPFIVIDVAMRVLFANEAFGGIVGLSADELRGEVVSSRVHSDDISDLDEIASEVNRGGVPGSSTVRFRRADGSFQKCFLVPRAFASQAGDRCVILRGFTTGEVSSRFDPLTGLLDYEPLVNRVERVFERVRTQEEGRFALLLIGIDRFTVVNVRYGWAAGNTVLRIVADRLSLNLRPGDIMARVGGDRFCVLLERLAKAGEGVLMAERVARFLGEPFRLGSEEVSLSVSIGVVDSAGGFGRAEEMMSAAAAALAEAKTRPESVIEHSGAQGCSSTPSPASLDAASDRSVETVRVERGRRFLRLFTGLAGLIVLLTLTLWFRPLAERQAGVPEVVESTSPAHQIGSGPQAGQPTRGGTGLVELEEAIVGPAPAPTGLSLEFQATEEVWVRVSVDGALRLDALLSAGQSYSFDGERVAELEVGNAGGLTVEWNGSDLGSLGRTGEVRRLYFTPAEVGSGRLPVDRSKPLEPPGPSHG